MPTLSLHPLGKPTSAISCNERALIYVGFQTVSRLRALEQAQQHSSASQEVRAIDSSKLQAEVADISLRIGSDWIQQFQKGPKTYSGMNLKELTKAIGNPCDGYYAMLYGVQSKAIHAADVNAHISYCGEEQRFVAKWYPVPKLLRNDLILVMCMVYGCLDLLNKMYRFDGETDSELSICFAMLHRLDHLNTLAL